LAGREETAVGQPQQSIASCYHELAMAVVKKGVLAYMRWRECGYVNADGSINIKYYWDTWAKKRETWAIRTMALNKAKARLEAIRIDTMFYHRGLNLYLKILGYEEQKEWLRDQITTRICQERGADHQDCFA
jgi:hypothetical protein